MLDEYILYLDESESDDKNLFCLGGVIIKNDAIENLETSISEIKEIIWDKSSIERENPILHSTELNFIKNNRNNPKKHKCTNGSYTVFNNKTADEILDIYNRIYVKLADIIKSQNITTVGCIIDKKKFKEFYEVNGELIIDNFYDIAMQEIIEIYSHFLCSVNGIGSIVCEARCDDYNNTKSSPDVKMYNNFCKIKVNSKGISYINYDTLDTRIRNLEILGKKEDNAGLQLTDFVVFNFIKWSKINNDNDKTDFMKRIHHAAYNAGFDIESKDMRSCWGIRMIPFDFTYIDSLLNERKTIKRANDNLKRDRNKIARKYNILKNEKQKLKEELQVLKEENDKLNAEIRKLVTDNKS